MDTSNNKTSSLFEDYLQLGPQLEKDNGIEFEELHQRDRKIGQQLTEFKSSPVNQIRRWLAHLPHSDSQIHNGISLAGFILVIIGLIVGAITASALFHYTGRQPINIINVLMIGVGLQLLMLIVFCIALLPEKVSAVIPGLRSLQQMLNAFNSGRWISRIGRVFPAIRDLMAEIDSSHQPANINAVIKWQFALWSQYFALAFNIALIAGCFYLVAFSDLAFGWSTTLDLNSTQFKSIIDTLTIPWYQFAPQAIPDLSMIDASRYYRLNSGSYNQANELTQQAQMLGNWWKFLLLCLVCYGLFPRILTMLLSRIKLNSAIQQGILATPGVHLLLDRMNRPSVETVAIDSESELEKNKNVCVKQLTLLTGRHSLVVHWGEFVVGSDLLKKHITKQSGTEIQSIQEIGINLNEPTLEMVNADSVILCVKSWEPPTLELTDWLTELRLKLGSAFLITVYPYALGSHSQFINVTNQDSDTWQKFLSRNSGHDCHFFSSNTP